MRSTSQARRRGKRDSYDIFTDFTQRGTKARRKLKRLIEQNDEIRREQIKYILNTLKLLVLFLHVLRIPGFARRLHDSHKAIKFMLTLESRVKLTFFVLLQRLHSDERMNRIAQEAVDHQEVALQIQKNRKLMIGGVQSQPELEDKMLKMVHKESAKRESLRKKCDQFGNLISEVDEILYNHFNALELCKLRLEFLALLSLKKEFLFQNFDDETSILVSRFEEQIRTNTNPDYLADVRQMVSHLRKKGKLHNDNMDPVKMYFQKTLKSLILGNVLTGPALCMD